MQTLDNVINEELSLSYVGELLKHELDRQNNGIELIASENYPSTKVRSAMASIATAKYAEGYPNKRYYGGCEFIDKIEQYAIDKACELFKCKYANVQPHSGSQANMIAYKSLERLLQKHGKINKRKMKILTTSIEQGAHLSHGASVNFSSDLYKFDFFDLGTDGRIDFRLIEEKIKKFKPDVLLTGYSAYPYTFDFLKFRELADKYNLLLMVDIAHIAGLAVSGEHPSPFPYADIVTSTTQKTLRGPRGGVILTDNEELIKIINSTTFPYYQGGPLEHVIASKALCFEEALQPEFVEYIKAVKTNTKVFAQTLKSLGVICTDSENHLLLIDTKQSFGISGKVAQKALEQYNITTNKNMLPNDIESPFETSGLRIGFAALTTRGCTPEIAITLAQIIFNILKNVSSDYNAEYLKQTDAIYRRTLAQIIKTLKRVEEI